MNHLRRYSRDLLVETLEVSQRISSNDPIEQFMDVIPRFANYKYDHVDHEKRNNYSDFIIKHAEEVSSTNSFNIVNMLLSEKKSLKQYFKGKIFDDDGRQVSNPDLTLYTKALLLDFIRQYLDEVQNLNFDSKAFAAMFSKFSSYVDGEINTALYYSPLYNFKSDFDIRQLPDKMEIRRITTAEFKDVANLGVQFGKQPEAPWFLWPITHILCVTISEPKNFYQDNQVSYDLFSKNLRALKVHAPGDIKLGALYRRTSSSWKTKTTVIGIELGMKANVIYSLSKKSYPAFNQFHKMFHKMDFKGDTKFLGMAINRFTSTVGKDELDDRIVDYVICLESLLLSSPGEASLRFANRAAILLGNKDKGREFLWKFMREAYNLRSGIVHGEGSRKFEIDGISFSQKEISVKLEDFTRDAIKKVLGLISGFKKQKALLEELDLALLNRRKLAGLRKSFRHRS